MNPEENGYGTIDFEAIDGTSLTLHVLDYFFYNGEEFAVLADRLCGDACEKPEDACEECDVAIYYMKVENEGDEETFTPIEDEDILQSLDDAYHAGEEVDA